MESTNPKDKIGQTKPPLHLIPPTATIEEAVVMGLGAKKYGPFNWRRHKVQASVYIAACKRHLESWFDGEDEDPESNASHLAHARACLGIMLDAEANDMLVDDRPPIGCAAQLIKNFTLSKDNTVITATEAIRIAAAPSPEQASAALRPTVYIAGPMRGYENFNFPAFDAARDRFVGAGWDVISPADLDREHGDDTLSHVEAESNEVQSRMVQRDLEAIRSLDPDKDAIAMLPQWEGSRGATAEFAVARWLGLTVLSATTMQPLKDWNGGLFAKAISDFIHFDNK